MRLALLLVGLAGLCAAQPQTLSLEPQQVDLSPLPERLKGPVDRALREHDFKRAETILVAEINANPQSAEVLKVAARIFLLDRDPLNAAIAFRKADKIQPLDAESRYALAIAFVGIGKGDWARPEFEALLKDDPSNILCEYWLGRLDYDAQLYDSAVARLTKVTHERPAFSRAWDNLALSLEGEGKLDEAVKSYHRAIDLNRKERMPSPWPPLNLGILLTRMNRLGEAEALLREALRYNGRLWTAHYRLGVNLQRQGKEAQAVPELEQAAQLAPNEPDPLYILGQIYRAQGENAKAAQVFTRFRELKKVKRGEPGERLGVRKPPSPPRAEDEPK